MPKIIAKIMLKSVFLLQIIAKKSLNPKILTALKNKNNPDKDPAKASPAAPKRNNAKHKPTFTKSE